MSVIFVFDYYLSQSNCPKNQIVYIVFIRSIALSSVSMWSIWKTFAEHSDKKKLISFKRDILHKIYGPKRNVENTYEWRTMNTELRIKFNDADILHSNKQDMSGYQRVHYNMKSQYENQTKKRLQRQKWIDRIREDFKP